MQASVGVEVELLEPGFELQGLKMVEMGQFRSLRKIYGKADAGFFVGFSFNSKAFRVFNSRTRIVEENLHIRFSESTPNIVGSGLDCLFEINALTRIMNYEPIVASTQSNSFAGTKASDNAGQARKETKFVKDYILLPLLTADPPFSQDPKNQEKKNNVNSTNKVNTVSSIVNVPGTNEDNKLLFDPMASLEDVSIFNFSSDDEDDDFVAYQMDVKSAFLYGKIEKEVYVCQPPGFEDPNFPDRVYKVEKALYGLHQDPRPWFTKVKTASTPMETQKPLLKDEDDEEVDVHMYRSMIGSLMYFTSSRSDIMFTVCACARYQVNPKVSHLHAMNRIFRYCHVRFRGFPSYLHEGPPSPDYVPGPEHPPPLAYPLPVAISLTANSPGYIPESDPEEEDEDLEESSEDDADDEEEEEEHPASANSITPPVHCVIAKIAEVHENTLSPKKKLCIALYLRQDTDKIYGRLDDAQDDRLLMSGQLNMLRRDRHAHARTARLMESKAKLSREAWVQSKDGTARAE
nr:retrovirus-related Pol polyprotein from transposon TNT 1-94 [Tanacetum cinerariifolium]